MYLFLSIQLQEDIEQVFMVVLDGRIHVARMSVISD